jgi:hypothetical protein
VAFVRSDVSEEGIFSIIRVVLIVSTLMMEAIGSSESSVLRRSTRRHIPEYGILLVL